jgi:diguanylate cyclase (GGDEF)-like protein
MSTSEEVFNYRKMTTQVVMDATDGESFPKPPSQTGKPFAVLLMMYGEFIGKRFIITDKSLTMGRDERSDISLLDTTLSRAHCRFIPVGERVTLEDLNSTNHTYVNGERIQVRDLVDGDQIRVGRTIFKFLSSDNIEQAYHEEIYRLMSTDSLTGAHNRAYFDKEIVRVFSQSRRYNRPLSLAMIDIDHFKYVNDTHGHLFGDRVLAQLGTLVAASKRDIDIFARYGGEEFVLILPETELQGAVEVAERVRRRIARSVFEFDGKTQPIAVSIGVASYQRSMDNVAALIEAADFRLYQGKNAGRNRVEPSLDSLPRP